MVNLVRVGLTASIAWRQFSTVASKNSWLRFFGCGPYQDVALYEPAISTQQRAPTASASAMRCATYCRFSRRLAPAGSIMFFQAPTSAIATFSAAKAVTISRLRAVSSTLESGQYAALRSEERRV